LTRGALEARDGRRDSDRLHGWVDRFCMAGLIVSAWLSPQGLESAGWVATVIGVVPFVLGLIRWVRQSPNIPAAVSSLNQVGAAERTLAALVLAQWRNEIAVWQLDDPAPLAVYWRFTELNIVDHAHNIFTPDISQNPQSRPLFAGSTDDISDIAQQFRALSRRRLVILGDPRMGKTTLAVLLIRELLQHRRDKDPVPVLFSMSDWDPSVVSLHDWLTRRLSEDYPALRAADFGPDASRSLVDQRRILPVLDGLDELHESVRPEVLLTLNAGMSSADTLILTCRTAEYHQAVEASKDVLTSAAVIEPALLDTRSIAAYISNLLHAGHQHGWELLLAGLTKSPASPLARALTTPLALWLLRKGYIDTGEDPAELCDRQRFQTPRAVTEQLLDRLVQTLVSARRAQKTPATDDPFRPRHIWDPSDAQRWLAFLAHHLSTLASRDFAWWQLIYALPARWLKLVFGAWLAIGVALVVSLLNSALGFNSKISLTIDVTLGVWASTAPTFAESRR
jgi:hypothetical protein